MEKTDGIKDDAFLEDLCEETHCTIIGVETRPVIVSMLRDNYLVEALMRKLNLFVLALFSLFPVNCGGSAGGGETYRAFFSTWDTDSNDH